MKKVLIFLSIVSLVVANDKSDIESLINKHWESWNSNKYKDYISTIHSGGTINGDSNGVNKAVDRRVFAIKPFILKRITSVNDQLTGKTEGEKIQGRKKRPR